MVLSDKQGFNNVFLGDILLNNTRFICAIILHMSLMPEIRCALELMSFARHNPRAFYGSGSCNPFMISVMKLMGGIITEVSNILIIIES